MTPCCKSRKVSGVPPPADPKNGRSNRERNSEKRITNIEQGIMNIEVRYSIYYKKTERSDSIIRHSSFQCSFIRALPPAKGQPV
ncbi:hypothetical protein D1AOALGA4SA_2832 [Olavius algarvensis Delta 1 endosymbiont]|nr:hypothetical protein D1AOALGA4SA_2832 [Olavius algarvensis Delta 1 endosymbiont]